ncbi:hypothetical protein ACQWU4_09560 [Chryseobacterium sp. MIQD13]|uniref:hypothetical protein n=1 Tax=Chryseobacterium sp. MIQD13 TaxID=3422310 RepID=UPI003D28BABD
MKKLFIISSTLICNLMFSQVGINTATPDPSSALDIYSNNKGTLFPRVEITSFTDAVTIPNPAKGLMIYKPSSTNIEEGLYVNVGTPSNPKWDMTTNTKKTDEVLTNPAYMMAYEAAGNTDQYVIYSPTIPLYTYKTIELKGFVNPIHSTKITLPKDGIYSILVRPVFEVNYNSIATKATSNAYLNIQFVVNKTNLNNVTTVFDYFRNSFYIRPFSAISGNDFFSRPASTLFISGKAGETFTLSLRMEGLVDNDGLVKSVKLLGGSNSGYTSFAITTAESPDLYLK